jgi:hypothetical protein
MNKADIKQIIFEEIEAAIKELNENMSPEDLAADSRPEEDDITPPGIEDMSPDPIFGADPSYVEEEELSEMPRTSNKFKLSQNADLKQVLQFMQRVNNRLKTFKSPGQKRPKKRFTPEEMKALATAMLKPEGFTSKDVIAATSYNSPAQANKFLKALEMKGLITLTSQLKKAQEPTRDPDAPETRGRKRRDAEFDMADDPTMMDFGDFDDLDLSDPLAETKTTMTNLEKYIKQQIKEAKNPLAKKMKEIENQGRRAALETKLAAIDEMIEETEGRLTRIDEDNEFRDMMDKNAVKEVRKQLKELERAKAKLQKEYGKMKKMALPKNYDEDEKGKVMDEDLPVAEDSVEEDAIDAAIDEVELEEDNFALNESTLRMQKLAGLITESDVKKKLSLKENVDPKTSMWARNTMYSIFDGVYDEPEVGKVITYEFNDVNDEVEYQVGPDFYKVGEQPVVAYEDENMKVTLRKLNPNDPQAVKFNKTHQLAATIKREVN